MTYAADTSLTATLKVTVKEAEPVDTVPPVISGADDVAVEFGASFDPMAGVCLWSNKRVRRHHQI
ncbi:hypothetical protein BJL93_02610 [Bifidobacterium bifidum]|nr:hypothetical protein [Bifidobacterium bifidum]MCG2833932.1 hypothetical protein [Bifidobacterium bifidum]OSP27300.1 hypothetical protein BJL93_02610 [Bifidobacterium bifidum]